MGMPYPDKPPEPVHEPPPTKHGKHHHRPLEARTNWDPWLPATEAYPEVAGPLHLIAMILLVILGLLFLVMIMEAFS